MSWKIFLIALFLGLTTAIGVSAAPADRDADGVPDKDEIEIYWTDPDNPDTDGDGFGDWYELNSGFSPYNAKPLRLEESDTDNDGLSDKQELAFRTDPRNPDTDSDGISDGDEIKKASDPLSSENRRLEKKIEIDLAQQKLYWFVSDVRLGEYRISGGKPSMPTPKGEFKIKNKIPKAWSRAYKLWMPYWMGLGDGRFGMHELPLWPSGHREGEDHLGRAVSHGCIRLGIGPAKTLYDWAEVGMKVKIY